MAATLRSACTSGTGAEAALIIANMLRWPSARRRQRAFRLRALKIRISRARKLLGEPIGSRVAPTSAIAAPSNLCQMSTINTGASVARHMSSDLGEIGLAGAGLVHEFAVEHHHQA